MISIYSGFLAIMIGFWKNISSFCSLLRKNLTLFKDSSLFWLTKRVSGHFFVTVYSSDTCSSDICSSGTLVRPTLVRRTFVRLKHLFD